MTVTWTSRSGNYCRGIHSNGVGAWFVRDADNGWQQLYGTTPPAEVLDEYAADHEPPTGYEADFEFHPWSAYAYGGF